MNLYIGNLSKSAMDKIAESFSSIAIGSAKTLDSNLFDGLKSGFQNLTKKTNLQSTIPKAMEKADVQPLHVRSGDMNAPKDITTSLAFSGKNKNLAHIKDPRLINSRTKLQ
jgi:hypothetical protein